MSKHVQNMYEVEVVSTYLVQADSYHEAWNFYGEGDLVHKAPTHIRKVEVREGMA